MSPVGDTPATSPTVVPDPAADPAPAGPELALTGLPAVGATLAPTRAALADFVRETGLPADRMSDVLLAVYEAMANIVEHAYPTDRPGTFDVRAAHAPGADRLTVTITDHGDWKNEVPDPASCRGRGLLLMRSCSDAADVRTGPDGTRITLQWRCDPRASLPDDELGG